MVPATIAVDFSRTAHKKIKENKTKKLKNQART